MKKILAIALLLSCISAHAALFGRNDWKPNENNFTWDDLRSGLKATKEQCVGDSFIWAEGGGESECIRFYFADFSDEK